MNLLKRELAPITEAAWSEIDDQGRRSLESLLTARRFADVSGPHGPGLAAVPTGRLAMVSGKDRGVHRYGVLQALHLIEVRIPFELSIWELDNAERGAKDLDLSALEEAAKRFAAFEEGILYSGSKAAGVHPFRQQTGNSPIAFSREPVAFLRSLAEAVGVLKANAVDGPYGLVVDPSLWTVISSYVHGRPLQEHLQNLLGGPVLRSEFAPTPFVVSMRGGDLEIILGQDAAIGYQHHDSEKVELYFTESFTFRLHDPAVAVFFEERG